MAGAARADLLIRHTFSWSLRNGKLFNQSLTCHREDIIGVPVPRPYGGGCKTRLFFRGGAGVGLDKEALSHREREAALPQHDFLFFYLEVLREKLHHLAPKRCEVFHHLVGVAETRGGGAGRTRVRVV